MADNTYDVLGELFTKLADACISHQIAQTGYAIIEAESHIDFENYSFTLDSVSTYNVIAKIMVFHYIKIFGLKNGLVQIKNTLQLCFTESGDISDMGLHVVGACHIQCMYDDLENNISSKVMH